MKIANNEVTYTTGNVSIIPQTFNITSCFATIVGCRAKPEALEKMRSYFEVHPWPKHCQRLAYYPYQIGPTAAGMDVTQQIPLENTTSFILLFPSLFIFTFHSATSSILSYTGIFLKSISFESIK